MFNLFRKDIKQILCITNNVYKNFHQNIDSILTASRLSRPSKFDMDFNNIRLDPGERPEELFQKLTTFI